MEGWTQQSKYSSFMHANVKIIKKLLLLPDHLDPKVSPQLCPFSYPKTKKPLNKNPRIPKAAFFTNHCFTEGLIG